MTALVTAAAATWGVWVFIGVLFAVALLLLWASEHEEDDR